MNCHAVRRSDVTRGRGRGRRCMREQRVTYGIDAGVWVDLQCVDVVARILEEAVVGVEHLVREQVEPLARDAAVVEALLAAELHHQPLAQVLRSHLHHLTVRLLQAHARMREHTCTH